MITVPLSDSNGSLKESDEYDNEFLDLEPTDYEGSEDIKFDKISMFITIDRLRECRKRKMTQFEKC